MNPLWEISRYSTVKRTHILYFDGISVCIRIISRREYTTYFNTATHVNCSTWQIIWRTTRRPHTLGVYDYFFLSLEQEIIHCTLKKALKMKKSFQMYSTFNLYDTNIRIVDSSYSFSRSSNEFPSRCRHSSSRNWRLFLQSRLWNVVVIVIDWVFDGPAEQTATGLGVRWAGGRNDRIDIERGARSHRTGISGLGRGGCETLGADHAEISLTRKVRPSWDLWMTGVGQIGSMPSLCSQYIK